MVADISTSTAVGTSDIIVTKLNGRFRHYGCDSRRQKSRDNLTHLLPNASLIDSSPLVEAVVTHLSAISWLCVAKRANIESFLLLDSWAPSPNVIKDV